MNKAVTDGLVLMPPPFAEGLAAWSSGDGTAGSPSYDGASNAAFVPADQDFAGCLELLKTQATQKLRWTGETPILPGCYLEVRARVKAMSGNLPAVRIAAWAGDGADDPVTGIPLAGPSVTLTGYGTTVTVRAIIGTGNRQGVDMPWGTTPVYGHFGLDLTGPTGGVVRIDDLEIEDVTAYFHRKMMDWEDVRDWGAAGDGTTDDRAAFEAASAAAAAAGRTLLVSAGTYHIGANLTLDVPVRFEGTVTMAAATRLQLTRNFDLPSYARAFGGEVLGFRKAMQALLNFTDHVTLDLGGRRIELDAPIDVAAAVASPTAFQIRRTLANGQFNVQPGTGWDTETWTRAASYSAANPTKLTGVSNVAAIPVGALVQGTGVGREIYVTEKNEGAGTLTLSQPLHGAAGTQQYTLTRFKYVLDFAGFSVLDRFEIVNVEFYCAGEASGIMLAPQGENFRIADCIFNKPRDRAITSIGLACQNLMVDRCQFLSNEMALRAQDRTSIALNVNANDAKIRDNRVQMFAHFAVCNGSGHMFLGNHFFGGDSETNGVRQAGLVLGQTNVKTTITGNYIDNSFVEWTNEYSAEPDFAEPQFSFGGLTVCGNIFTVRNVAPWFRWLVVKPHGSGHFIQGLNVSGNVFRTVNATVDRVDHVDTSFATLDFGRTRNLVVEGNAFNGVTQIIQNPVTIRHIQNTAATTWTVDSGGFLPFGAWARRVQALVFDGPVRGPGTEILSTRPYTQAEAGAARDRIEIVWPGEARGTVDVTLRADNPL
ncbi:MAG: right-handed parallel beta-helix repeat-containing protein [Rhodobacteraceae bacterium]|nr:right-handed parallel beta-helix repeat-containing protein [Paracoccaceae bacterium]